MKTASKIFDVIFSDDYNSDQKGFRQTKQECLDYIECYNGTDESYFKDYKDGYVGVINLDTEDVPEWVEIV